MIEPLRPVCIGVVRGCPEEDFVNPLAKGGAAVLVPGLLGGALFLAVGAETRLGEMTVADIKALFGPGHL